MKARLSSIIALCGMIVILLSSCNRREKFATLSRINQEDNGSISLPALTDSYLDKYSKGDEERFDGRVKVVATSNYGFIINDGGSRNIFVSTFAQDKDTKKQFDDLRNSALGKSYKFVAYRQTEKNNGIVQLVPSPEEIKLLDTPIKDKEPNPIDLSEAQIVNFKENTSVYVKVTGRFKLHKKGKSTYLNLFVGEKGKISLHPTKYRYKDGQEYTIEAYTCGINSGKFLILLPVKINGKLISEVKPDIENPENSADEEESPKVEEGTYYYRFSKEEKIKKGANKLNNINWDLTIEGTADVGRFTQGKGYQIGSKRRNPDAVSLKTSDIKGKILEITIETSISTNSECTFYITVGGASFGNTEQLTDENIVYTFTGDASGEIDLNWISPEKAIFIKSIKIKAQQ